MRTDKPLEEHSMETQSLKKFESICKSVMKLIPAEYKSDWRWDEEFYTVLIAIKKDGSDQILSDISKEFDHKWDHSTLDSSKEHINKFFTYFFGLTPGQSILTVEEPSGLVLFTTWWPWGDLDKVSLRMGICSPKKQLLGKADIKEYLIQWFDI
jgi:hypothetical protein